AEERLFSKDFIDICNDTQSFLYHIGPIVLYQIIQEDLQRREFGHCYYVEKNAVIKLFPENMIKKMVIDYWSETFQEIKPDQVDSYMNYSKGIQGVKSSYAYFFEKAAATRKRGYNDSLSMEDYLKSNAGKFFGYRRTQVYRRFVSDNVFGLMPEVNSTELLKKFFDK
ncbi:MAG: hypothetical protein KDK45_10850, partial [Leptospiraceae bacterium]|nr:hypothetical protein [Leptospiraceae bacterium]